MIDNWVVYSDGTAQKIKPTIYSPDTFMQVGQTCDICVGVESLTYKVDGSFRVLYAGQNYLLEPSREIEVEESAKSESTEPSIVLNDNGTLTYTAWLKDDTKESTRKRGKPRSVKSKMKIKKKR